jgi:hypothetical protein
VSFREEREAILEKTSLFRSRHFRPKMVPGGSKRQIRFSASDFSIAVASRLWVKVSRVLTSPE